MLHPCGHRDRAGMTSLSLQIDNRPVLLALLNMAEIQLNCLMASYATREQQCQKRSITFFLQALAPGVCHNRCDCSVVSQFPN